MQARAVCPGERCGCALVNPMKNRVDAVVVGAGHAGCEAALALARMGVSTALVTFRKERAAWASCNPAIGGLAKGHLAREIDALGGQMGLCTDRNGIQFRRLNLSKGPAVRSSRAQIDMYRYSADMLHVLENQPGLTVVEDEVVALDVAGGRVTAARLAGAGGVPCQAVVITAGTFLRGVIHVGLEQTSAGRVGDPPSTRLAQWLADQGFVIIRLKTGTPARIKGASIDFESLTKQWGDDPAPMFSWKYDSPALTQTCCYETRTVPATHEIIRANLDRAPMYSGQITGTGPRYCPSIEDKVVRFAAREHHQIFVEPTGLDSDLYYPNGISTSLPLDVQIAMLRSIPGLERAEIGVPAYAIEYDAVHATQLHPTLETRKLRGLYLAGQVNGTSGYEEAGGQGLVAAVNAALQIRGEEPVVLGRDQAYIGVLVDDLTTQGTEEPYRMFTSRAEYRLLLREANAPGRLTKLGRSLGLVRDEQWDAFEKRQQKDREIIEALETVKVPPDESVNDHLKSLGSSPIREKCTLRALLTRTEITLAHLMRYAPEPLSSIPADLCEDIEARIKFEGYIRREANLADKLKRLEEKKIPESVDYQTINGLTTEVIEKLEKVRPATLGQASRIPGVTPAAVANILMSLK